MPHWPKTCKQGTWPVTRHHSEAIARATLEAFNRALAERDAGIARSFHKRAQFRGSEPGEEAVGRDAIGALLAGIFASSNSVQFDWQKLAAERRADTLWLLAVGDVVITAANGSVQRRPYSLSGVLVKSRKRWRWWLFHGSEPWIAPAASPKV